MCPLISCVHNVPKGLPNLHFDRLQFAQYNDNNIMKQSGGGGGSFLFMSRSLYLFTTPNWWAVNCFVLFVLDHKRRCLSVLRNTKQWYHRYTKYHNRVEYKLLTPIIIYVYYQKICVMSIVVCQSALIRCFSNLLYYLLYLFSHGKQYTTILLINK